MNRYREVFPKKHALLVVVHVESLSQALENTGIAKEAGADGVFLINNDLPQRGRLPGEELIDIYREVRAHYLQWWIGLNILDTEFPRTISLIPSDVSGIWEDNAGINERARDPVHVARCHWELRQMRIDWQGLYFGGVAFKYQAKVSDPAFAAQLAMPHMDVVTTSGEATGSPADVEKIRTMREAIEDFPLAVASGITPENVSRYLGLVDCFIVATGVSRSFTELDPKRINMLATVIETI